MILFFTNPELDRQISQIKRQIRLSMDGIIADSMTSYGITYKKNYGVSINRIREIAKSFEKNHDLAQRLWLLNIRETMILATLLQPINTFTYELASQWLSKCDNIELIEQSCMNLYQHLKYAVDFSLECIQSEIPTHKIFGFTLALRTYQQFSPADTEKIILSARQSDKYDTHNSLYNAIALCLARFCRKNEQTAFFIYNSMRAFEKDILPGKQHIYQTVTQELSFLGYTFNTEL